MTNYASRQELLNYFTQWYGEANAAHITDFILRREREQIEKVVEPLREEKKVMESIVYDENLNDWNMEIHEDNSLCIAIEESLAIADEITKG